MNKSTTIHAQRDDASGYHACCTRWPRDKLKQTNDPTLSYALLAHAAGGRRRVDVQRGVLRRPQLDGACCRAERGSRERGAGASSAWHRYFRRGSRGERFHAFRVQQGECDRGFGARDGLGFQFHRGRNVGRDSRWHVQAVLDHARCRSVHQVDWPVDATALLFVVEWTTVDYYSINAVFGRL